MHIVSCVNTKLSGYSVLSLQDWRVSAIVRLNRPHKNKFLLKFLPKHVKCSSKIDKLTFLYKIVSTGTLPTQLEMWANAQRDGRPAEHRWRPLLNAAKLG